MFSFMLRLLKALKMLMNKEGEEGSGDMMSLMKNKWKKNREDTITIFLSNL